MIVSEALRQRFLRDPLQIRLGNIASALARAASWSDSPEHHEVVGSVLKEATCFCEWAVPDAPPEMQAVLAELQAMLAGWESQRQGGVLDSEMCSHARRKSDELLKLAGLVE